jgi:hypothetical protein
MCEEQRPGRNDTGLQLLGTYVWVRKRAQFNLTNYVVALVSG